MTGRARRRADMQRIKRRVRDYYRGWASRTPRTLGKVARTRALCSCEMGCGNPRRNPRMRKARRTVQERRTDEATERDEA